MRLCDFTTSLNGNGGDEAKKAHEATVSKYGHTIERRTDNKVFLDGVPQN